MKYAVLRNKLDFGLERGGPTWSQFQKPEIVFKLDLILSNKLLRIISPLSPNRVCCSGLNNGSIFYLLSILYEWKVYS
ncbi:hypothetical protein EGT49_02340 [Companilactobacillus suantsaicola]|uniref:Uncharacterized protein n=1 Tax=Companilactobacillus suantsaicola TaxID=2487723 RepID=A0A4Z0JR99_9LACO|nr:hypothetical protein EGT49_02340 [Companilactobacillus suantsaicola]